MRYFTFLFASLFFSITTIAQDNVRVGIAGMTHDHVGQVFDYMQHPGDVEIVGFTEPDKVLAFKLLREHNLPEKLWFLHAMP